MDKATYAAINRRVERQGGDRDTLGSVAALLNLDWLDWISIPDICDAVENVYLDGGDGWTLNQLLKGVERMAV